MPATDNRDVTKADVLTGRVQLVPLMNIAVGQRLCFNYRLRQLSFEAEIASAGSPHQHRDFLSLPKRATDSNRERGQP